MREAQDKIAMIRAEEEAVLEVKKSVNEKNKEIA